MEIRCIDHSEENTIARHQRTSEAHSSSKSAAETTHEEEQDPREFFRWRDEDVIKNLDESFVGRSSGVLPSSTVRRVAP